MGGEVISIDNYCERLDASFWAEPVNAITNLSFLIAAYIAAREIRSEGRIDLGKALLVALMIAIGIGSFLFHTFGTSWAALADVLPITLFIMAFLALVLRRGFDLKWWWAGALTLAFLPLSNAIVAGGRAVAGGLLGSSVGYLPAFTALLVCGLLLARRSSDLGPALLIATGLFAVSLTFRTLDLPLCSAFPLGTHFVWHILNGVLLGYLVVSLSRHATAKPA